jgi:hypothetical protein
MNLAELHPPSDDAGNTTVSAWIPGDGIPVVTEPIDAPEGLLVRIRPTRPLETGNYAAHWGALDGAPVDNEQRMFFFSIVDTITPPAELTEEVPPAERTEEEPPTEPTPETQSAPSEENDSGEFEG